jgi:hypothetical protein
MPTITDWKRLEIEGHDVELRFFIFDTSQALNEERYQREHMEASDYGWMVTIDGVQHMGVFPRLDEAVEQARGLIADMGAERSVPSLREAA